MLTSGCAAQSGEEAADRASHFYGAVAARDGAAACADLAPEARETLEREEKMACDKAVLQQDLPATAGDGDVHVYGSMAQVVYPAETAFLSRYGDEWLLTAVGCSPASGDAPHVCAVEVG